MWLKKQKTHRDRKFLQGYLKIWSYNPKATVHHIINSCETYYENSGMITIEPEYQDALLSVSYCVNSVGRSFNYTEALSKPLSQNTMRDFLWEGTRGLRELGDLSRTERTLHLPHGLLHSSPCLYTHTVSFPASLSSHGHWIIIFQVPKVIVLVCGWLTTQHTIKTMPARHV